MVQTTVSMPPEVKKRLDERADGRPIYKMLLQEFLEDTEAKERYEIKDEKLNGIGASIQELKYDIEEMGKMVNRITYFMESMFDHIYCLELGINYEAAQKEYNREEYQAIKEQNPDFDFNRDDTGVLELPDCEFPEFRLWLKAKYDGK